MAPDLITPYYDLKAKNIQAFPCHTNRASSLGGACTRELVYERTSWDKAVLHDVDLQIIFEEGEVHEKEVLRTLQEAGITVIEQQRALDWKEHQITGHVDAVVVLEGQSYPLDVKSMSPHIWDGIFCNGKGVYTWPQVGARFQSKPWLRKYLGQITLYCLLKEVESGILLCKNKGTGALAQVNIPLDYDYAETLIQRATEINRHVAGGTMPDRIAWDEEICGRCKFLSLCLPERVGKDPLTFLEDSTVEALIEERAKLSESGKEFDRLDKRFKDWAKARPESKILIGSWLVTKNGTPARTTVKVEKV